MAQDYLDQSDPETVTSDIGAEQQAPATPVVTGLDTAAGPSVGTGTAPVPVGAIRITGLSLLATADFMDVILPYLGQTLDTAGQQALLTALVERLHRRGFPLGSAVIAPQAVAAGVLTVRMDEGHIDAIRIQGDENGHAASLLRGLADGLPVTADRLSRAILLAERVPGVRVARTRLVQEGQLSILEVRMRERRTHATIGVDNSGTSTIGPVRARMRIEHRGLLASGDEISAYVATTPLAPRELQFGSLGYSLAVGQDGLRLGGSVAASSIDAIGSTSGRRIRGSSESARLWADYPLLLAPGKAIGLSAAFAVRDSNLSRGGVPARADRTAILTARITGDWSGEDHRLSGRVELSQGTDLFDATRAGDPLASRPDGDGVFTKLGVRGRLWSRLAGPFSLWVDSEAQFASRPLLFAEEFGFGGRDFGRGYEPREASADNALAAAVELRLDLGAIGNLVDGFQVYGYGDGARLWEVGDPFDDFLATAGMGIRARLGRRMDLGIELGMPVDRDRTPRGNFEATYRF